MHLLVDNFHNHNILILCQIRPRHVMAMHSYTLLWG